MATYKPIEEDPRTFCHSGRVTAVLGLPGKWFEEEVDAGRIPHLVVGKNRRVFNVPQVRDALLERMWSEYLERQVSGGSVSSVSVSTEERE